MRSARVAIFAAVLVLILLPLAFLGVAYGYERWLLAWYESRLAAIAERLAHAKDGELLGIATQTHVWARRLDAVANPLEDSGSGTDTLSLSPLGGLLEAIAGRTGWTSLDGTTEALTAVEQALGPLADRPEVQAALAGKQTFRLAISPSGRTELFMVAAPGQRGGAVYVLKGSRLGVRRLFQLRAELLKLAPFGVQK